MADSKLSALTVFTGLIDPKLDRVYLDDVSATTAGSFATTPDLLAGATASMGVDGLLTLSATIADYQPASFKVVPLSTDFTTTESVTFTNPHGLTVGTMVTTDVTAGGLTAGTTYFAIINSTTSISFATTLANALASTKLGLSANITGFVIAYGVQNTTLYLLPHLGRWARLWDGTRIKAYDLGSSGVSLALSGLLTSGSIYDVWLRDNAGTLTLDVTVWTSFGAGTSVRATLLDYTFGWPFKAGDQTRLYVGSVMAVATDTCEDSSWYPMPFPGATAHNGHGKRFVFSALGYFASRARLSWNAYYTQHTLATANNWQVVAAGTPPAQCAEILAGLRAPVFLTLGGEMQTSSTQNSLAGEGITLNRAASGTTTLQPEYEGFISTQAAVANDGSTFATGGYAMPEGYNYIAMNERAYAVNSGAMGPFLMTVTMLRG